MPDVAVISSEPDYGRRLPGGLSPWRGRLLVYRSPLARMAAYAWCFVIVMVVAPPLGTYLQYGAWAGSAVLVLTLVLAGIYASPFVVPGVRVTPRSQPELAGLVAEVAARACVRPPDRIWLTQDGRIRARVLVRRRELLVGEALLVCLSRAQTAALIAHELTTMDYRRPWLVWRLLTVGSDALHTANDPFAEFYMDMEPHLGRRRVAQHRRAQRLAADIAPFAAVVHRRADAAACTGGGNAGTAASAFAHALAVDLEFPGFPFQGPGDRPEKAPALIDLIDGWRRCVARGIQLSTTGGAGWIDTCVDELGREHPDLLAALRPFATIEVVPTLAADSVAVAPLTPAQRSRPQYVRTGGWMTFAEVPSSVWIARAAADAGALRRRAANSLGRDAVDDLEVTTVLLSWDVDEAEAGVVPGVFRGSDPVCTAPPGVSYLVEDQLLPRGFRLEHPAVRGVLLGPAGQRIDARRLVGGTYLAPDLTGLRDVLAARQ